MCAALAPIIKSGYNLYPLGSSPTKTYRINNSADAIDRLKHNGHSGSSPPQPQTPISSANHRVRCTSEQSTFACNGEPKLVRIRGPPPVDIRRHRSAMSTSQFYLHQRRELAKKQELQQMLKKRSDASDPGKKH